MDQNKYKPLVNQNRDLTQSFLNNYNGVNPNSLNDTSVGGAQQKKNQDSPIKKIYDWVWKYFEYTNADSDTILSQDILNASNSPIFTKNIVTLDGNIGALALKGNSIHIFKTTLFSAKGDQIKLDISWADNITIVLNDTQIIQNNLDPMNQPYLQLTQGWNSLTIYLWTPNENQYFNLGAPLGTLTDDWGMGTEIIIPEPPIVITAENNSESYHKKSPIGNVVAWVKPQETSYKSAKIRRRGPYTNSLEIPTMNLDSSSTFVQGAPGVTNDTFVGFSGVGPDGYSDAYYSVSALYQNKETLISDSIKLTRGGVFSGVLGITAVSDTTDAGSLPNAVFTYVIASVKNSQYLTSQAYQLGVSVFNDGNSIDLNWSGVDNIDGYYILRYNDYLYDTQGLDSGLFIAEVDPSTTSFQDIGYAGVDFGPYVETPSSIVDGEKVAYADNSYEVIWNHNPSGLDVQYKVYKTFYSGVYNEKSLVAIVDAPSDDCVSNNPNLVSWWKGNSKGRTLDSSTLGNNLTQIGNPLWPSVCEESGSEGDHWLAKWDSTTTFSDYFTLPLGSRPNNDAWTIQFKIKSSQPGVNILGFETMNDDLTGDRYVYIFQNITPSGDLTFEYTDSSGTDRNFNVSIPVLDEQIHTVKFTGASGDGIYALVDGNSAGYTDISADFGSGVVDAYGDSKYIGTFSTYASGEYTLLDDFRIYNSFGAGNECLDEGICNSGILTLSYIDSGISSQTIYDTEQKIPNIFETIALIDSDTSEYLDLGLKKDALYDYEVAFVSQDGTQGTTTQTLGIIAGDQEAPSAPIITTGYYLSGWAILNWTNGSELDLDSTIIYKAINTESGIYTQVSQVGFSGVTYTEYIGFTNVYYKLANQDTSYNLSDLTSGYAILSDETFCEAVNDCVSGFLPLSGGTMSGNIEVDPSGVYNIGSPTSYWANGYFDNINGEPVLTGNFVRKSGDDMFGGLSIGTNTIITGNLTLAVGNANTTIGLYSLTQGENNSAIGDSSQADGYGASSIGNFSHTEGYHSNNGSVSIASHAEGGLTVAGGGSFYQFNITSGVTFETPGNYVNELNLSSNVQLFYLGGGVNNTLLKLSAGILNVNYDSVANKTYFDIDGGIDDRTSGYLSITNGNNQHAEGSSTVAWGYSSHSEGIDTLAFGAGSHAEGIGDGVNFNIPNVSENTGLAFGDYSHSEGQVTRAIGNSSHTEGYKTIASGDYSHAEGTFTQAIGLAAHAEGDSTLAIGHGAHSEGWGDGTLNGFCVALGDYSHAENYARAEGVGSHAEGNATIASGDYSHSEGDSSVAFGFGTHAEGETTLAYGDRSHSEGTSTIAFGASSHAEGMGDGNFDQTGLGYAIGDFSHSEGYSKAIGNGSHSEGFNTQAFGESSHSQGNGSISSGINSFAAGTNAQALHDYSTVISDTNGAISTADNQMTLGFSNGVILRSGTDIIPEESGVSNDLGSEALPFRNSYTKDAYISNLHGLSPIKVFNDLIPNDSGVEVLGSASKPWNTIYADNIVGASIPVLTGYIDKSTFDVRSPLIWDVSTLSGKFSSATESGFLSHQDWSTFNSGYTASLTLTGYAKLDGSNQPFTSNLNISNTGIAPEYRLTNGNYSRILRTGVSDQFNITNQVNVLATDGTGGTITHVSGYTIHTFATSGSFTFTPNGSTTCDILVIGAGGGGGKGTIGLTYAGGGGGGGLQYYTSQTITSAKTITVGGGGLGGASNASSGTNGQDSTFQGLTSAGGGLGGGTTGTGGSSGSPQSNAGGTHTSINGTGGGGAGGVGQGVSGSLAGGIGSSNSITGASVCYGGGGGGANDTINGAGTCGGGNGGKATVAPTSGTDGLGGGGGGMRGDDGFTAGKGGNGTVIIRYIPTVATTQEIALIDSRASSNSGEYGTNTYGPNNGATHVNGNSIAFDVNGTTKWSINSSGGLVPVSMADSAAANGTMYYSTTANKLVFKDSGGVVNNLY